MSHQKTLERMNAELNTADTWARRWQIEREHNERLNSKALRLRGDVLELRRAAVELYFDAEITRFKNTTGKLYSNNREERQGAKAKQTYQPNNYNDTDGA